MATVNKNFKVKNGLIVEGTEAKVNNYDILTKKQDDQDYIISLIGGTATPNNTPDTVVKRDGSGNFAAQTVTVEVLDVSGIGTISDDGELLIAASAGEDIRLTADDIRMESVDDIRMTASGDILLDASQPGMGVYVGSIDPGNTVVTESIMDAHIGDNTVDGTAGNTVYDRIFNAKSEAQQFATDSINALDTDAIEEGATNLYFTNQRAIDAVGGTISDQIDLLDTDDIEEGSINLYFQDSRARGAVGSGNGLNYDSNTGVFSAHLGNGLEFSVGGEIQIDNAVVVTETDLSTAIDDHSDLTTGVHGVTGNVVGTSDSQTLTNKTFEGTVALGSANTNDAYIQTETDGSGHLTVHAGADLTLSTSTGDIVLNADGGVYVGSVSAGNTVATNSYVDNAVAGLDWKNSVHLLYDAAIPVLSGSGASQLIIDGHDPLGDADSGYRVLITQSSDAGIYVYNSTSGNWTLTRADDADTYQELVGAAVFVMEGTQYGNTSWVQSSHYLTDFTGQSWTQFSGSGAVVAGTGITVDGLEVSIDRTTVDTWYDAAGTAASEAGAVQDNLDSHTSSNSAHGVIGDIVGTSDSQTLTNKTLGSGTVLSASIDAVNTYTVQNLQEPVGNQDAATKFYVDSAETDAVATANLYTDGRETAITTAYQLYADDAEAAAIAYADGLTTSDIAEGTNLYFTNQRAIDAVGGTIGDAIDLLDTDDIEEGSTNLYYTSDRAKTAAADLLTNATLANITITGTGSGLTITAENGVADSTTDDLDEGSTNKYFTDARAVDALEAVVPNFTEVDINSLATQVAATVSVATASSNNVAYSFAKADYRSAEFLVKTAYGNHTEISKVLLTLDTNDNIAITEYGTIGTNGAAMTVSADIDGSNVRLLVTTANNSSTVTVVGTLLA